MAQIFLRKQPHEQQQKFINCTAREQLYGGAKRGGKSVALCQKGILLSYFFPGNRGLLARKDFTDLQDTTLNEFFQVCPPELLDQSYGHGGHHKGERCIRIKTLNLKITSDILYRGLGGETDIEKAKGLNLGWMGLDEPSEIDYETYKMLNAQLTWRLPDGTCPPYMALLASNPEPGWVKDEFFEKQSATRVFIPSLPRQNPHLPPGWEDTLRADYDKEWVDKYLDGSWEVTEGTVFAELSDRIHAIDPIDITGMSLMGAIDYGSSGITTCILVAKDADSNMFVIDEHYEKDKLLSIHVRSMSEMIDRWTPKVEPPKVQMRLKYLLIDPSTQARTQQTKNGLQSILNLLNDDLAEVRGDRKIQAVPAYNFVEAGLERMKEYIHPNPRHIHPLKGSTGSPKFFIVRRQCPNTWKEMRDFQKKVLASGAVRYIGSDHAIDPIRYIFNSQPKPAELTARDERAQPLQDRFARRAHERWAKKFANQEGNTQLFGPGFVN